MASINLGPFGDHFFHWFEIPPNPISIPNFLSLTLSKNPAKPLNFSCISLSSDPSPKTAEPGPEPKPEPGKYQQMLDQFWWECENLPDYRHTPEVEKILGEDPLFEHKENPSKEEVEENQKWWEEFRSNPVTQFLARAEEIADQLNERELKRNEKPYRFEDRKLWKSLPHVTGLDGRPMPRRAIRTPEDSDDKFLGFL